jgi:hypothetical protein
MARRPPGREFERRRRIAGLVPGVQGDAEIGVFDARDGDAAVIRRARPAVRIEGQDLLVERQGLVELEAGLVLLADLDEQRDVLRIGPEPDAQGAERVLVLEDLLDLLVELRRRRRVGVDPVDLVPVPVEEQEERRPLDLVLLEDLLAGLGAPVSAVEDEVLLEEFLVGGVGIILLDQQFAGPSAAFLVEIEEQELVVGLRLGQGLLDRPGEPGLAEGGGGRHGKGENQSAGFFHLDLLVQELKPKHFSCPEVYPRPSAHVNRDQRPRRGRPGKGPHSSLGERPFP